MVAQATHIALLPPNVVAMSLLAALMVQVNGMYDSGNKSPKTSDGQVENGNDVKGTLTVCETLVDIHLLCISLLHEEMDK